MIKKAFKYLSIPILISFGLLAFGLIMSYKEITIKDKLNISALCGHENAILILRKYPKPERLDRDIVEAALKNNPHACSILKLDEKEK
jgi:hypothetical protein